MKATVGWVLASALVLAGGGVRAAQDEDTLKVIQEGVPLDLDIDVRLNPAKLPIKKMISKMSGGWFVGVSVAVAARTRSSGMRLLTPMLRKAVMYQLQGEDAVNVKELAEEDTDSNPTVSEALDAAAQKGSKYLLLAVITGAGEEPEVLLRMFTVKDGAEVTSITAPGLLKLRSGARVLEDLRALRTSPGPTTLMLNASHVPLTLPLVTTNAPQKAGVVGVAVHAEDPELADVARALESRALKDFKKHKGVTEVERLKPDVLGGVPDADLAALAAREELDALVAFRIRRAAGDADAVEVHMSAVNPGGSVRWTMMSRRLVVRALTTSTEEAVKTFRQRAMRAQMRGLITTYSGRYGSYRTRSDVPVLVDDKGEVLDARDVADHAMPEDLGSQWNSAARVERVSTAWGCGRFAAFFCFPLGGALLLALAGGAVGLGIGVVGAVLNAPVLLGAAGALFLAGGVVGGILGVIAYGGTEVGLLIANLVNPGVKSLDEKDAVRTARESNLALLRELKVDPVMLDVDYFATSL